MNADAWLLRIDDVGELVLWVLKTYLIMFDIVCSFEHLSKSSLFYNFLYSAKVTGPWTIGVPGLFHDPSSFAPMLTAENLRDGNPSAKDNGVI